ncbi:hypothetical protein BMF35_a1327 [Aurantiacibacter gangjinensis]|nr:hypothetical protein BMF35_a1327 [Aurantiacibacter gangjinensis]
MLAIIAFLIAFGLVVALVDLSFLLSDPDQLSGRSARRARTGAMLVEVLPYMGWFAVAAGLVAIPLSVRKSTEVEITPEGISCPPALKETLPWNRVERLAIRKMMTYRVLAVFISDAGSFPIKPLARKVAQMNKTSGDYGDINIELNRSDGNFDAMLAVLEQYREVEPVR